MIQGCCFPRRIFECAFHLRIKVSWACDKFYETLRINRVETRSPIISHLQTIISRPIAGEWTKMNDKSTASSAIHSLSPADFRPFVHSLLYLSNIACVSLSDWSKTIDGSVIASCTLNWQRHKQWQRFSYSGVDFILWIYLK